MTGEITQSVRGLSARMTARNRPLGSKAKSCLPGTEGMIFSDRPETMSTISNCPVAGADGDPTAVGTEIENPERLCFQNGPAAAQVPDHAPVVPLIIAGYQESSVRAEFQEVGMMSRAGQDHQRLVVREPADAEVPLLIAPDISFERLVEQEAIGPRRHRLPGFGESNIGQGQAGDGLVPQFEARSDSGGGGQFLEALEALAGLAAEAMGPGPGQLAGGGGARLFQAQTSLGQLRPIQIDEREVPLVTEDRRHRKDDTDPQQQDGDGAAQSRLDGVAPAQAPRPFGPADPARGSVHRR